MFDSEKMVDKIYPVSKKKGIVDKTVDETKAPARKRTTEDIVDDIL